jgi:hypothetical protein
MRTPRIVLDSCLVFLLFLGAVATPQAATMEFFGSRDTFGGSPAAPNPTRCGTPAPPNLFLDLPAGPGISNLGAFSHKDSHCINVLTGNIFNGLFEWDFGGGDTIFGTFLGTIMLPPVNGVASFVETFTLTGGTGQYLDSTGGFLATGSVMFQTNSSHLDFRGLINTVPEPATMTLLMLAVAALAVGRRGRIRRKHS